MVEFTINGDKWEEVAHFRTLDNVEICLALLNEEYRGKSFKVLGSTGYYILTLVRPNGDIDFIRAFAHGVMLALERNK